MEYKFDCKFFKGSMPCINHKTYKAICKDCQYYKKKGKKILIVKIGSGGDVLRTTAVLPALKKKYPHSVIYWLVDKRYEPLLYNNPDIDKIFNIDSLFYLTSLSFDLVVCLENIIDYAYISSLIKSAKYSGFYWDSKNEVAIPADKNSEYWYNLGINDSLKKINNLTYQQILFKMLGLKYSENNIPRLYLTANELNDTLIKKYSSRQTIGFAIGSGARWKTKRLPVKTYCALIKLITRKHNNVQLLIFIGPEEKDLKMQFDKELRKNKISRKQLTIIDNVSTRKFATLINICDIIITGDTLALHLAAAFNKQIYCVAGPTSVAEIAYKNCDIIVSEKKKCLVCYKTECNIPVNCMEDITAEIIYQKLKI